MRAEGLRRGTKTKGRCRCLERAHRQQLWGPYSEEMLTRYVREGRVAADTFIWHPDWSDAKQLSKIEELKQCMVDTVASRIRVGCGTRVL